MRGSVPRAMAKLDALRDLVAFRALDFEQRQALSGPLAESLGEGFLPLPELVGTARMVTVEHTPSGVQLVAVPGGAFAMGFTERDEEALGGCVDTTSPSVLAVLQDLERAAAPVHWVTVAPFVLSRTHLTSAQALAVSAGAVRFDVPAPADVAKLAGAGGPLRLPSEAELEYVAREGGAISFVDDGATAWSQKRPWPAANAWGFRALTFAAWAADEWHDDYRGAPLTAAAWSGGGLPGVYRGCLVRPPATAAEVPFALAACRGRLGPDDEWDVGLRVARVIDL